MMLRYVTGNTVFDELNIIFKEMKAVKNTIKLSLICTIMYCSLDHKFSLFFMHSCCT